MLAAGDSTWSYRKKKHCWIISLIWWEFFFLMWALCTDYFCLLGSEWMKNLTVTERLNCLLSGINIQQNKSGSVDLLINGNGNIFVGFWVVWMFESHCTKLSGWFPPLLIHTHTFSLCPHSDFMWWCTVNIVCTNKAKFDLFKKPYYPQGCYIICILQVCTAV